MVLLKNLWTNKKSAANYVQYAAGIGKHIFSLEYARLYVSWINCNLSWFFLDEEITLNIGRFFISWKPGYVLAKKFQKIIPSGSRFGMHKVKACGDHPDKDVLKIRWYWGKIEK